MPWPFKARATPEPCFPVGPYRIDTTIDGLEGLTPLSPAELVALNVMQFEGGQIWHAPEAAFMDLKWDTMLGTVHGAIYKISIQWTGPRHQAGKTYRELAIYCTKHYRNSAKSMALWDASDGNIILDITNIGAESILNAFVTSEKVRQFRRL